MEHLITDPSWKISLSKEFNKPYFKELKKFLEKEYSNKTIYPSKNEIFSTLNILPLPKVKVVILGQDPYHGPGQAHGLSFSVPNDCKLPPSLKNIYKELKSDLNIENLHGDLTNWVHQGVLLLNATLTVEHKKAGSHQKKGWEAFTDSVLKRLNEETQNIVYILWGSYAQKKAKFINPNNNHIIKSPHPSPLSSYRGFFDSKPFSKANDYLIKNGVTPINWEL